MITHSLRWKLLAWIALLLAVILAGFGFTAYELAGRSQLAEIDDALARRVTAVALAVRTGPGGPPPSRTGTRGSDWAPPPRPPGDAGGPDEPPPDEPSDEIPRRRPTPGLPREGSAAGGSLRAVRIAEATAALFAEQGPNDYFFGAWGRDGTVLQLSPNAPPGLVRPEPGAGAPSIQLVSRGGFRWAIHFTERSDCVVVGIALAPSAENLRRLAWWLGGAGLAVMALGVGGGWWVASRAIRPIDEISAAAQRISAGNLAERIAVRDPANELGRLAAVLNSTFARLEAAFAEQKQFTADASHELRTPLAVLISEAQSALARSRSEAEYRETIETCLEAAQEMRRLAESLLELARIDSGQALMRRTTCDLAALAHDAVELLQPLAAQREIEIETTLTPAPVQGDPGRIKQVLVNLLDNAIYYNVPRGRIRVETSLDHGTAVLRVTDTGPGIAPEDLPHIFKRFYRADKSRTQSDHRSGLGLAIVQSIIEAHGGTIVAESQYGAGSTFTVRLPA